MRNAIHHQIQTRTAGSRRRTSETRIQADEKPLTRLLITTSPKVAKVMRNLFEELVGVFPGAEFFRRKERGSEMDRIAG